MAFWNEIKSSKVKFLLHNTTLSVIFSKIIKYNLNIIIKDLLFAQINSNFYFEKKSFF